MAPYGPAGFIGLLLSAVFLQTRISSTVAALDCPLDLSRSNFTLAASLCSNQEDKGKCCRYINAVIAVSVSQYANTTSNLGIPSDLSATCIHTISKTFELYGVTRNATIVCGFGTKIPLNYECQGRSTVTQMLESPKFSNVTENCKMPLSGDNNSIACRKCLNAGILYLRNLLGPVDNITLSTCRDATFVALASGVDYVSNIDIASCFFGISLLSPTGFPPSLPPQISPIAASPTQLSLNTPLNENRHPYHLTVIAGIAIAVTVIAVTMLVVLIVLIRRKTKQLENDSDMNNDTTSPKAIALPSRKFQDGPSCMFRKFSYKETKKATNNFGTVIGQGGFGIVYKGEFEDGLVAAVKRMSKASEQADDDFCRELELLARLHHRHLVSLRGFCMERRERFLMYEYMANGSLKDHLHAQGRTPLSWSTRIQIAIDVANALEYLHFYCDPPLCHRDIKSSNILLDDNFVAKVADFGLAHASKDGSISFEPVNTDVRGTPGYMDPEYIITQELTEKSDVFSYGVVLLELITGRRAIQDNKNLVEWSKQFSASESRITELIDPYIGDNYDFDQLQTLVAIVKWCTQREGRARPSMKQVLRLLYESADPFQNSGFVEALEDDESGGSRGRKSRGKNVFSSGDGRCLASSSSTTRSHCSRSFLIENGSPQSPNNIFSI
ncbi:hypothetical protein ABFX02_02G035600 [Erythranthe guttata]